HVDLFSSKSRGRLLHGRSMVLRAATPIFLHQSLQRLYVSQIISRLVNRRLGDEGCALQSRIIQQDAEHLQSKLAATDVLVPVELRPAFRLCVVAMPNTYILTHDCTLKMLH